MERAEPTKRMVFVVAGGSSPAARLRNQTATTRRHAVIVTSLGWHRAQYANLELRSILSQASILSNPVGELETFLASTFGPHEQGSTLYLWLDCVMYARSVFIASKGGHPLCCWRPRALSAGRSYTLPRKMHRLPPPLIQPLALDIP